jgi:tRNA acetyltransferase TAN1
VRRFGLHEYNLLVACPRERERAAISEIKYFIGDLLEDSGLGVSRTYVSGLLACSTSLNPFEVVRRLREFAIENPYQFRFAIKFTPIEVCVETTIPEIVRAAERLMPKIGDDSFRVSVRKRHTELDSMEVIVAVAHVIPKRVNLDNPDWTVLVEIVGEWSGVSVLKEEEDILSIMKMRDDQY